jgi:hypothetical protein
VVRRMNIGSVTDEKGGASTDEGTAGVGTEGDQPCNGRRSDGSKLSTGDADLGVI